MNIATIDMNLLNLHKVDKKFTELFGVSFDDYYDHNLSVMMKRVHIDIDKFDAYLITKGMRENIESMNDFILRNYGSDARSLILRLL